MAYFILILGILIFLGLPFLYYSLINENRKSITQEKNFSRIMIYGFFMFVSIRLISESLGLKMAETLNWQLLYYAIIQILFFAFGFIYAGFVWLKIFKKTNV